MDSPPSLLLVLFPSWFLLIIFLFSFSQFLFWSRFWIIFLSLLLILQFFFLLVLCFRFFAIVYNLLFAMKNLTTQVSNLDVAIKIGDLLQKEVGCTDLALVASLISLQSVSLDALLRFHKKNWTKQGGVDMKVAYKYTFISYFEVDEELKLVLKYAPCVSIFLLVVQKLYPGIFSFQS